MRSKRNILIRGEEKRPHKSSSGSHIVDVRYMPEILLALYKDLSDLDRKLSLVGLGVAGKRLKL